MFTEQRLQWQQLGEAVSERSRQSTPWKHPPTNTMEPLGHDGTLRRAEGILIYNAVCRWFCPDPPKISVDRRYTDPHPK